MSPDQLGNIESSLGITLPDAYKNVMSSYPWPEDADTTDRSLWDDAGAIVEWTQNHRAGFGVAPAWPNHLVFIGDEHDACPYALDCITGRVTYTDHGNMNSRPLDEYASVPEMVASINKDFEEDAKSEGTGKPWWKVW